MNTRLSSFVVLLASITLFSCIDDEATDLSILQDDIEEIDEYLASNPIDNVKEFEDENYGFHVFWHSVSESGIKPAVGDSVWVNYTGKTLTNRVFDTNIEEVADENGITKTKFEPLGYVHGAGWVIFGFEYGVSQMEKGDKVSVIMPSTWAYGRSGQPDIGIEPNEPLIFEIELLDIKPQDEAN